MSVKLRSRDGTFELTPGEGENLLFAGLRAGAPLPYECATGTCGSCRARVKQGKVANLWAEAPGAGNLKRDAGEILLCQSTATAACEILLPGRLVAGHQHRFRPVHGAARLVQKKRLTPDVIELSLVLDTPFSYMAGQFLALRFSGLDGYRAFSMTTFRPRANSVSLVIKRVPGGGVSQRLFEEEREENNIEFFGPLGGAVFVPEERRDVLCIAGGSGIAGMLSILDHARQVGYFEQHRGKVYFGLRTLEDAFCLKRLARHASASPGLEVTVALSEAPAPCQSPYPELGFESGFVHEVALRSSSSLAETGIAYVAGPPAMVDRALRGLIVQGKFNAGDIRYDKFA